MRRCLYGLSHERRFLVSAGPSGSVLPVSESGCEGRARVPDFVGRQPISPEFVIVGRSSRVSQQPHEDAGRENRTPAN
jgi:hypothetical protein